MRRNRPPFSLLVGALGVSLAFTFVGCKTRNDLRRDQEMETLRNEVSQVRGDKADMDVIGEEVKGDVTRLSTQLDEHIQHTNLQNEEMRKELTSLTARVQALEQHAVQEEIKDHAPPPPAPVRNLDAAKAAFEAAKYDDAISILKELVKGKGRTPETRKANYLLAEAYFQSKDFASAALEFSEYKKAYAKDPMIPNAIYRQAQSFKSLGKPKEARLFYQELIDRYPKHALSAKAKQEMKK